MYGSTSSELSLLTVFGDIPCMKGVTVKLTDWYFVH